MDYKQSRLCHSHCICQSTRTIRAVVVDDQDVSGKTAKIADTMLSMLRRSLYVQNDQILFSIKRHGNSLVGVSIRTVFVQIYICSVD